MDAVAAAQNAAGFRFELFDTCVLKDGHSLTGIIFRTYHDFHSHEPIADCLIISHVPVEDSVLQSFLISGIPPKGYVFIRFARPEFGHSLVAERDVRLVGRSFAIGDSVKGSADDAMIGTVMSISDSYVLEPIWGLTEGNSLEHQKHLVSLSSVARCDENCVSQLPPFVHHPLPHVLLYDVPGDELRRADDCEPGDYVIERDYLGIVQDHDIDAVLLLENFTAVMVENAWELELVVPNFDRPLVALPEYDEIRRPDVVAYHVGGKASIPTDHLSRGQLVTTNHRNLRNGRWLSGKYDPLCNPQGHILDVRTRRAHVKWLCPNVYAPSAFGDRAPCALRPYDNLSSYSNPRDLRRTKGLTFLDRGQQPPRSSEAESAPSISTGQDFEPGDQVRFRDQSGAFVKYQGRGHGQYSPISKDATCGFDMNEFIVFCSKQTAKVRWQDGSVTESPSVLLKPYVTPEQELCPGDIVFLKEGSSQVAVGEPEAIATPFNEMTYVQGDYVLRPEKVGIIQSVDARERLVRIRWFLQPSVRLLQQGKVLQNGAYFGPISDNVEDFSLYEIMAHPALLPKRRDLVIIAPLKPSVDILCAILHHPSHRDEDKFGSALLSWMRPPPGMDMYTYMRTIARPLAEKDLQNRNPVCDQKQLHSLDWVGEIVDLGLDGMLTVRLPHGEEIRVPWERVLTIVDEDGAVEFPSGVPEFLEEEMEDEHYLSDESAISAIEETIEYEGGNRIDNESGEEGWSTDADERDLDDESLEPVDTEMMDVETGGTMLTSNSQRPESDVKPDDFQRQEEIAASTPMQQQRTPLPLARPTLETMAETPLLSNSQWSSTTANLMNLAASQASSLPSFLVLDTPPPPDQFLGPGPSSSTIPASSTFLKRIHREHRLLSTSLPHNNQIYVRTYDSRLDLLRALILGPGDTPYESAPFVFDFYLPPTYPSTPPIAHFHSWTSGLGRINPNLYEEGKICLSLLGTWPGRGSGESDTWSEQANILQVLMSLMGLVLVKRPFYNEAGFEASEDDGDYAVESLFYSEKAYVMARGFVKHALLDGISGMEDVLAWVYLPGPQPGREHGGDDTHIDGKQKEIVRNRPPGAEGGEEERPELLKKLIQRAKALMDHSSTRTSDERDELVDGAGRKTPDAFMRPLSRGAVVMLSRHLEVLARAFQIER